jgi:VWFA-related protein
MAATLAWAMPVSGQVEPADSFAETIEVQVVTLEVVVTDKDGRRVHGLPADAFRVRMDGEEIPIQYFSELGARRAALEAGEGGPAPPAASARPPVNFLIFIDDHVTLERNRDFTLIRLRRELELLGPEDRMAIVAYDGRKLRILSPWTQSRERLDAALDEAMARPAVGIKWVALQRMEGFVANWVGNATRRSVLATASSMRSLPQPDGRKVLLLIAGSWDPAELERAETFSPWCLSGPCAGNWVLASLTDTANLLGYTIYAVDVEGRDVQQSWAREQRLQATLSVLARETGGLTLLDGERRSMLSIAAADSRSYYSLGIAPRNLEAESYHRIEVTIRQPGLEARSRESFVAASQRRRRELETLNTLLLDGDRIDPGFPVTKGPPEPAPARRMQVPVSIFVPVGEMEWLEQDGRHVARFQVQFATLDSRGNSSDVESHEVTVESGGPPRFGELEHLTYDLELRRRRHTLAVLVRDLQGERVFSSVTPVEPPDR